MPREQSRSLDQYAADLARSGVRIIPGEAGTCWAQYESGALMRLPTFHLTPPAPNEVRRLLWRGWAAIASYLQEPDECHPANAWLYICTDHAYSLDKLAPTMRRNVHRGLRELKIAPLTPEQLLTHGVQPYCETRRRVGLNDGTLEAFHRSIATDMNLPEVSFLGAWKDDQLAAFLIITEVDDWAEIECFSRDALLHYRPNDTLMYTVLSHYLVERGFRIVSYGLSSIQAESNAAGLHRFKTKVGFEARPVHRAFVSHPLLYPFVNQLTLWGVNAVLRFKPGDRRLKKAGGMLACMLGDTRVLEVITRGSNKE